MSGDDERTKAAAAGNAAGGDATATLDASGLLCPMPVLRANRALRGLNGGDTLRVIATDPAAEADFPSYCRQTGHELVSSTRDGAAYVFTIRKKAE
ncbi:MAG: sulfurtransferase TusA family protein [Rhodospirillales bacterium]|nr:sulfurtransferase TusA family protein [Rhodospirillales bacterium]